MSNDGTEPEYVQSIDKVLKVAKGTDDLAMMSFAPSPEAIGKRRKQGFRILISGADSFTLAAGIRNNLNEAHREIVRVDQEG